MNKQEKTLAATTCVVAAILGLIKLAIVGFVLWLLYVLVMHYAG